MSLRVVRLNEFLTPLGVEEQGLPPFVHSTPSARIIDILNDSKILATQCNVFREKLCYLFVGRPAYKWTFNAQASAWQLPFVVMIKDIGISPLKRIYPFDTGAFSARILPDYITMFERERFNVGTNLSDIEKIISTFFTNSKNYMSAKAKSEDKIAEDYSLGVKHQEISALSRLFNDRSNSAVDDRGRTIELQIAEDLIISKKNVIGMILPRQYANDIDIKEAIEHLGCEVETYSEFPLSVNSYYGIIYQHISSIMRRVELK